MFRNVLLSVVLSATSAFAADPVTERPGTSAPSSPARVQPAPSNPSAVTPAPTNPAQGNPAANPQPARGIAIPGSVWVGTETLFPNGNLQFALRRDGTAHMQDNNGLTRGSWTANGNNVTVTFQNCVYRGQIRGNELVGQATVTSGQSSGQTWNFQVRYTDPYAGRTFTGSEQLQGFGNLTFRFGANGEVTMIDARSQVRGSYSYDCGDITMRFGNCEYVGAVQSDNSIRGNARYTDNPNVAPWQFSVAVK